MKALIRKDAYVLWRQMRVFIVLIVVMMLVNNTSFYGLFAVLWTAMLPFTALAYDERSHWDQLADMMPYSTLEIVLEKYVLGWLCIAGAVLLCLAAITVRGTLTHTAPDYSNMLMSPFIGMMAISVMLPMTFRFGVERGRMGLILAIIFIGVGFGISAGVIMPDGSLPLPAVILVPLAALAFTAFSIPLSVRFYRSRS